MSGRHFNVSCKPCRKARMGCDAVVQKSKSCTNCLRRRKACDIPVRHLLPLEGPCKVPEEAACCTEERRRQYLSEYQSNTHRRAPSNDHEADDQPATRFYETSSAHRNGPFPALTTFTSPTPDFANLAHQRGQAVALHDLLWDVFVAVFDRRSMLWFADSCNPFLDMTVKTKSLVSRTALELDRIGAESEPVSKATNRRSAEDRLLNNALRHAVYAYAINWLPMRDIFKRTRGADDLEAQHMEQDVRAQLWRQARTSMFPALSRPSYRSIVALFLVACTEMPIENDDPGFNHLCCQVLFSHFSDLRLPYQITTDRPLSDYTMTVPVGDNAIETALPKKRDKTRKEQEHMRDSLFWIGIIIDSTRSVIHQRPSVILPNREADASVWDLIRQRTVVFEQSFRSLRDSPLPLPADVTVILLQHAIACKTMNLGMLAQLFGALIQANATVVEAAAARVLAESRRFHDVFDKFLAMCSRDYVSMSADSRLNYVLLIAHYHLGSLVLADTLDQLDVVPEPLQDPSLSRLYACNAIVNALNLALNHDRYSGDDSLLGSTLLRDPTPVLMAEVLSRTSKSVFLLHESGQIATHTMQFMITVVAATLSVVSQVSTTAKHVLEAVHETCARKQLKLRDDSPSRPRISIPAEQITLLGMCDGSFVDEFLHEMHIQASVDGSLDRTIARYEVAPEAAAARPIEACRVDALLNDLPGDLWHANQVFPGQEAEGQRRRHFPD